MGKLAFASVWLLVFVIPWENQITLPGLGTMSRMVGFGAIAAGLISMVMTQRALRFHTFHLVMIFFIFLCGLSFFWSAAPVDSMTRIQTYAQMLVMVWLIFQVADTPRAVQALLAAYVSGAYVALISTFRSSASEVVGEWNRYAAQGFNPNDMAIIFALGIPMAWYLAEARGRGVIAWMGRIYPFAAMVGIALTASRNGMLGGILAMTYPLATWLRRPVKQKVGTALLTAGAVLLALELVPVSSWERIATFGDAVGGGMNMRGDIWLAGLEAFTEHPLLGWGTGAFRTAVEHFIGIPVAPHNIYLAILVETGLMGFVLFCALIGLGFMSLKGMPARERFFWFVLLGTWCICAFALNWEWRKQSWLLLVLAVTHAAALSPKPKETEVPA